jgi:hypothetical protein
MCVCDKENQTDRLSTISEETQTDMQQYNTTNYYDYLAFENNDSAPASPCDDIIEKEDKPESDTVKLLSSIKESELDEMFKSVV